ncbi:MAG: cellulase family glycosylhydrolase [Nitrososphaera sp.]
MLLFQAATPASAFSTTVISGELAVLTSAQLTDVRNACITLNLGSSTFCKSVSQKAVAVLETGDPDISMTVKENKGKRFLSTLAGAVVGASVNGVTFRTLFGDGKFDGSADHIVATSWGSVYFKNGQKSNTAPMTIEIDIDTKPAPSQLGSISGIASSSGKPVEGAVVAATMQGDPSVIGQGITDANGRYSITDFPPGTYDIEATASSYESLHINGVVVLTGADTSLDLILTLLPCSDRPVKDFIGVAFIDELLGRREAGGTSSSQEYVTESMRHISLNGFTAIRVPYYWESYVYNSTEFRDRIEFIAQTAQANGICVFFSNFQYYTTSYWNIEIAGKAPGRGFPSFVVRDFPAVNNDYVQTAGPFWDAFLSNSILINGSNVWDVQADLFRIIIDRVDHYDSVAGYEILNEPHFFDVSHYDKLGDYHTHMANEIRQVSAKKIFFDREDTWGFARDPTLEPKIVPRGVTDIVYAPHLYAIPYPGSQAEQQIQNFKTWSQLWNSEVLIGETVADTQADADQLLTVLKGNGFGWTVWSWKPTVSTGLGRTYYESDTVEATEVLKILLAAMAKVY